MCLPLRQVVEELLSGNPHIEKESARSIADGAMMEAASVCVGQMVRAWGPCLHAPLSACGALPAVSLCFWKAWRAETARGLLTTPAGPGGQRPHVACSPLQLGLAQSSAQRPRCFPVPPDQI